MTDSKESNPRPSPATSRRADDVDIMIGKAVRQFRKEAGLTQKQLGEKISLSFKQVRKYEIGENRISASMLYRLSQALDKPIEAFYAAVDPDQISQKISVTQMADISASKQAEDAMTLIRNYYKIPNGKERQVFLDLMRAISKSDFGEPEEASD